MDSKNRHSLLEFLDQSSIDDVPCEHDLKTLQMGGNLSKIGSVFSKVSSGLSKAGNLAQSGLNKFDSVSDKVSRGVDRIGNLADRGLAKVDSASNLLDQSISRAEQLTGRAQDLAERTSSTLGINLFNSNSNNNNNNISNSLENRDLNYTHGPLTLNRPLSPNSSKNFQSFGDYICLKKDFVRDLRILFNELFLKRKAEIG